MADKKLTREEYERLTKENMEIFAKLDRQIAEEREKEEECLFSLSEDEQVEYLWDEDKRINAEAVDRFKSSDKITTQKDE